MATDSEIIEKLVEVLEGVRDTFEIWESEGSLGDAVHLQREVVDALNQVREQRPASRNGNPHVGTKSSG